jgi:hypothetical protein
MDATNHIYRNIVHELNPRERMVSNVVGVIGGIALGLIAASGAAVKLASSIGVFPLGISLLVVAGTTIAAFFIFKKATSELIKTGKHTDRPVQTSPLAPTNFTTSAMPTLRVSQASIDFCKQQLQACESHVSTMVNNFECTLSNTGVSKEDHKIPGQVIQYIHHTMNQLKNTIHNILKTPGLTIDKYIILHRNCYLYYVNEIENQISKVESASNISNSNLLHLLPKNLDSPEAIKEDQKLTDQMHANQLAVTLLSTFRLTIGDLFKQISGLGLH